MFLKSALIFGSLKTVLYRALCKLVGFGVILFCLESHLPRPIIIYIYYIILKYDKIKLGLPSKLEKKTRFSDY